MTRQQSYTWGLVGLFGIVLAGWGLLWLQEKKPGPQPALPAAASLIPQQPKPEVPILQRESLALLTAYPKAAQTEDKQKLLNALARTQDRSITSNLIELLVVETDEAATDTLQWMLVRLADATMLRQLADRYESVPGELEAKRLTTVVQHLRSDELAGQLATFIAAPIPMEDLLAKAALIALREIGSPFAADALAKRLDTATTETDRAYLELALAGINRPGTQHSLMAMAMGNQGSTQTFTRLTALKALSNYHDPESKATVAALAENQVPEIAESARRIIARQP